MTTKEATKTEANSVGTDEVIEHFWPEHLSGNEVKTKWPRGRNVKIAGITIEEVFDKQINKGKRMVVVYFDGIDRGLVTNKTNGRRLAELFGGDSEQWVGKVVSIVSANRSNNTIGVDVDEPFVE